MCDCEALEIGTCHESMDCSSVISSLMRKTKVSSVSSKHMLVDDVYAGNNDSSGTLGGAEETIDAACKQINAAAQTFWDNRADQRDTPEPIDACAIVWVWSCLCVRVRCVVLCCVALRCVALRCVALCCVVLCCVVLCCVVLCCVVLGRVALCCVVLPSFGFVLCCVVLGCVVLC